MSSNLVYTDQSADALRLTLCTGSLNLNQFSILRRGSLSLPIGTLYAGIIGASHFLHFDFGNGRNLYEVFACTEVDSPAKRVVCGPLGKVLGEMKLRFFERIGYRFHLKKLSLAQGASEMEQIEARAKADGQHLGLVFEFPSEGDPGTFPPKTIVLVHEESPIQFVIKTVHSYPNEDQLVITQTTVTRRLSR